MASQFHDLAVKLADLLPDGIARFEQRSDCSYQLRTALDQFLGSHGEDIELGTADDETKILEEAADLILKIALNLDQQCPACQERPNRVAIEIFDAHRLEPTGLQVPLKTYSK